MTVLAASTWRDNASLIADAVVPLGYIKPDDRVIDVTYGRGLWWKKYKHPGEFALISRGLVAKAFLQKGGVIHLPGGHIWLNLDYRNMPQLSDDSYDVVCFDPPYVAMGGRKTSTLPDFMDRFGLEGAAATPKALFAANMAGLIECKRITRQGGLLLHKTCNYVSSGHLVPQVHLTYDCAARIGLQLVDEFTMVGHVRAQPPGRRQVHARNNTSTLMVFRKPPRRKHDRRTEAGHQGSHDLP